MTYSNLYSKYSCADRTNRKDSLFLFKGRNKSLKENDDKKASNSILHRTLSQDGLIQGSFFQRTQSIKMMIQTK